MCFHGNQHPLAIKQPLISLYSKYQSLKYICLPVMNSPVFPSLDDIYCIFFAKERTEAPLIVSPILQPSGKKPSHLQEFMIISIKCKNLDQNKPVPNDIS